MRRPPTASDHTTTALTILASAIGISMQHSSSPTAAIPFHHAIDRQFASNSAGLPPLLVLLHGSGDDEYGLLDVGRILAPACGGAVILSLRGPKPRGPGFCWFEGTSASPAADAEASIDWAADQVQHLLQHVPTELGTDPVRAYLFGHSQGASVAWAVALSKWPRPDLLFGMACNSGRLFPGLAQPSRASDAADVQDSIQVGQASSSASVLSQRVAAADALAQRHVLSAHGRADMITPVVHGQQNADFCRALGVANTYHEHDEGHNDLRQPLAHVLQHFAAIAQRGV